MFIEYYDSIGAHKVIRRRSEHGAELRVVLAGAWRHLDTQNPPISIAREQEISLNRLNADCLMDIFDCLDLQSLLSLSRVCDRFHNLIHERIFSRYRKISFEYTEKRNTQHATDFLWLSLDSILPHARDVTLLMQKNNESSCKLHFEDLFARNLSESLEQLHLAYVLITERMRDLMKSALLNLKVFKWEMGFSVAEDSVLDLAHLCPSLLKLELTGKICLGINAERWQSLESVSLGINDSEASYVHFFANNNQLKELEIFVNTNMPYLIPHICSFLTNLEKLQISESFVNYSYYSYDSYRRLGNLKRLKYLELDYVQINDTNYAEFMDTLGELKCLVHLQFAVISGRYFPEHCRLAALARKLTNLQKLSIGFYKLTVERLLAFISAAHRLTSLLVFQSGMIIDDDLRAAVTEGRPNLALHLYG